jgi:hypothetical protein
MLARYESREAAGGTARNSSPTWGMPMVWVRGPRGLRLSIAKAFILLRNDNHTRRRRPLGPHSVSSSLPHVGVSRRDLRLRLRSLAPRQHGVSGNVCPPGIYPHLAASASVEESVDLKAHDVEGVVYPGLRGLKAPLPGAS